MVKLTSKHINLRAIEPRDLDFLFQIENDTSFWQVSNTQVPFSKFILKQYLVNAQQDIYEAKQLRLIIEHNKVAIGMIDLFDFNPQHRRAGVGILLLNAYQKKGFANEALKLLINYTFAILNLHQLFANIGCNNTNSIALFKRNNFKQIGIKKDWFFSNNTYHDVLLFQLINDTKTKQ